MDLDDFVEKGIIQLIEGVSRAQQYALEKGSTAEICPPIKTEWADAAKSGNLISHRGLIIQEVQFDVAVSATEKTEAKGGLKIVISTLSGGVSATDSISSRMKFSVPLTLPTMPNKVKK